MQSLHVHNNCFLSRIEAPVVGLKLDLDFFAWLLAHCCKLLLLAAVGQMVDHKLDQLQWKIPESHNTV